MKSSAEITSPIFEQITGYSPNMKKEIIKFGVTWAKKYYVAKSDILLVSSSADYYTPTARARPSVALTNLLQNEV